MGNDLKSGRFGGRELIAFVHIEKAAGTSLIHVLRRGFFLRYADVRPITAESSGVFAAADLKRYLSLNPWLRCIGGHSVRPLSDLESLGISVRYITMFREPVARYLSQFNYWNSRLGKGVGFDEFLSDPSTHDFQTKKIAGHADVDRAEQILREKFALVGTAEDFPVFMEDLALLLSAPASASHYRIVNKASKQPGDALNEDALEKVRAVNRSDLELYARVRKMLRAKNVERARGGSAVARRRRENSRLPLREGFKHWVDGVYRKGYLEPVTGILRRRVGMSPRGSYDEATGEL